MLAMYHTRPQVYITMAPATTRVARRMPKAEKTVDAPDSLESGESVGENVGETVSSPLELKIIVVTVDPLQAQHASEAVNPSFSKLSPYRSQASFSSYQSQPSPNESTHPGSSSQLPAAPPSHSQQASWAVIPFSSA